MFSVLTALLPEIQVKRDSLLYREEITSDSKLLIVLQAAESGLYQQQMGPRDKFSLPTDLMCCPGHPLLPEPLQMYQGVPEFL